MKYFLDQLLSVVSSMWNDNNFLDFETSSDHLVDAVLAIKIDIFKNCYRNSKLREVLRLTAAACHIIDSIS